MAERDKIKIVVRRAPTVECNTNADCPTGYVCESGKCVKEEARPDIKVTANSPIPLFYRDENGVFSIPTERPTMLDLGYAICDARYGEDECWEDWPEECVILKDFITEYKGVEDMNINIRGYRGTAKIDFTTDPYTMHIVITDYPAMPKVECDKKTPHFDSGCKLLLHYDRNNDGVLDVTDSVKAKLDGMSKEELDFIKSSLMKGSINALCPGCYIAPAVECNTDADCPTGYVCESGKCERLPPTITADDLRWTNGTYRAAFTVTNLNPDKRYNILIMGVSPAKQYSLLNVSGITSVDIDTNISKADLDTHSYTIACNAYMPEEKKMAASEEYTVPPYTLKGTVRVGDSTIPTKIYLNEPAKFNMSVENTGGIEQEYAVVLTFRGVDVTKKYRFPPANTIRIPAGRSAINDVSVVMPSDAIPADKDSATFNLFITLEMFV